jgi:hypothetical protein
MRYGSNRYRYGGGDTPETADAEFAGRVEYVGAEPAFGSGYLTATQVLGLTITDVRRGSGLSVGDYVDVDVAVYDGGRHVAPGTMNPDVLALDPSMVQPGVTVVAWANVSDGRWQALDISTDGPASSGNYAGRSRRPAAYGRPYARGLQNGLDLTDYPTNVFVIIPDAQVPAVPREIRQSDHDALEQGWDRMMKGRGLIVDGPTVAIPDGQGGTVQRNLGQSFRELLRGGLADSPLIRALFLEIVNDNARPITFHIVHDSQQQILIDAFQFNPNVDRRRVPLPHQGHHTIDIHDFDQLPRVSGDPRNDMMLALQNLVHSMREARQGVLGNIPLACHFRAIADENLFRQEQGQIGALHQRAPVVTPVGIGHADFRWEFRGNGGTGPLDVAETWDVFTNASVSRIVSIDYFPA